jgi:hypothetical protein
MLLLGHMDAAAPVQDVVIEAPKNEARLEGIAGYATSGATGGAMASFRHGALLLAPSLTFQTQSFGNEALALRMGAGGTWAPTKYARLDAIGTLGAHFYDRVGAEPLSSAGASATRPFAGAWTGASIVVRPFTVGLWLFYEGDLVRATEPSHDPPERVRAIRVGGDAAGVLLRVGFAFET